MFFIKFIVHRSDQPHDNDRVSFSSKMLVSGSALGSKDTMIYIVALRFLVGVFFLKEKRPTITVGRFYSVDNLTLNGPLFLQFLQNSITPKGTPLEYFRLCETFFRKKIPKGSLFNFLMICDRMDEKSQNVPSGAPIRLNFWVFRVLKKRIL